MKCQDYVFLLTSGQLRRDRPEGPAAAGRTVRAQARLHRWLCVDCRRFAANDATLDQVLAGWRRRLQAPTDAER